MKYLYLSLLLFLSGCTPHLTVHVLKPAEINTQNKSVSISSFKNDYLNLADKIKYSIPINNLKNLNSDLSIEGFVYNPTYYDYQFTKKDTVIEKIYLHNNANGDHYKTVERIININCIRRTYSIDSAISIIENRTNNIIYNQHISSSKDLEMCEDINYRSYHNRMLLNMQDNISNIYNDISNDIAKNFTAKFSEKSFYKSIPIIEEPILKNDILKFKKAVEFIKNEDLISAEIEFKNINDSAAYYNLGLIYESRGNYFQALSFFEKAKDIPISRESINRVRTTIKTLNKEITY